jgi:hypothetical protein
LTCSYDPNKALCRRQLTADGTGLPDLTSCKPLRCRNVALTEPNRQALLGQLGTLDRMLTHPDVLAPYVAYRLTEQRQDLISLLAAAETPPSPED